MLTQVTEGPRDCDSSWLGRKRFDVWLAAGLSASALAAGVCWSWLRWPDPQIDFGRELYVPWRLSQGAVLYRDIAYWTGPLSVHWHALLFKVFGVSLRTVLVSNAVVLSLVLACVYRVVRRLGDSLAALIACLVLIGTSAFAQLTGIANYNFLAPYRHELTHGMLLGFLGLECIACFRATGRTFWAGAAGFLLGASLLTKVEVIVATASALPLGFVLALVARRTARARALGQLATFVVMAALPPFAAFWLLRTALPAEEALAGLLAPIRALLSSGYNSSKFALVGSGLDDPVRRSFETGLSALLVALTLAGVAWAARAWREPIRPRTVALAAGLLAVVSWPLVSLATWLFAARALPVLVLAALVLSALDLWRKRDSWQEVAAEQLPLIVWSAAWLAKMGLNARTYHYGFVLAAPSLALSCVLLLRWIPARLFVSPARAGVMRAGVCVLLLMFALAHVRGSAPQVRARVHSLGVGGDRFFVEERGEAIERLRAEIERSVPRAATIAVLPEGVMVNYLVRRASAVPNLEFIPSELQFFGEQRVLDAFQRSTPDWVVIIPRDTAEYGARFFGLDYGLLIGGFVRSHYRTYKAITLAQPSAAGAAVLLLKRRASTD